MNIRQDLSERTAPVQHVESVSRLTLTAEDAAAVRSLATRVVKASSPDQPLEAHLTRIALLSHELPFAVREALVDLRLSEKRRGGLVLSGLTVVDERLGDTPETGAIAELNDEVALADATLLLISSLMGDPISHAGIEDGKIVRDVCPVRGSEAKQLGTSSSSELTWHNEDAFHQLRADWLFLLCLRNPAGVATSFARLQDVLQRPELNRWVKDDQTHEERSLKDLLFEERFYVCPDSSHLSASDTPSGRRIAVLSGDPESPFVCLDPDFMSRNADDAAAEEALDSVIKAVDDSLREIVLKPGDMFVIDNLRSVHGRRSFEARFDGHDRWLRTVHAAADLRRSEGRRAGWHGRAVLEQL